MKARHRITTVTGVSGAAIAYDYKPCASIAVREVAIGGRRDCRCIVRRDNFLFAGVHGAGVAVLDITDPRTSPIINTVPMQGAELVDFTLDGNTLYAADFANGVHAIDVSDPKQPRYLATHPALAYTQNRRVLKSGDLLALVNDHAFSLFDVSKPGELKPLGMHFRMRTAVGYLRSAVLDGKRLHLTQGPVGVWTFDLSEPTKPQILAGQEIRLDSRPNERLIADSITRFESRVFVGTSSGVWVAKLAESGAPESETFFTGPGTIRDVARGAVRDKQLFFCAMEPHDHVLHIFDDGARYMGRQRLSRMIDRLYDLEVGDGYWIAAAGNSGVLFASY